MSILLLIVCGSYLFWQPFFFCKMEPPKIKHTILAVSKALSITAGRLQVRFLDWVRHKPQYVNINTVISSCFCFYCVAASATQRPANQAINYIHTADTLRCDMQSTFQKCRSFPSNFSRLPNTTNPSFSSSLIGCPNLREASLLISFPHYFFQPATSY